MGDFVEKYILPGGQLVHVGVMLEALARGGLEALDAECLRPPYAQALWHWGEALRVQLDFIRPGEPVENGMIESFNGRLRDECLNTNVFTSIEDARRTLEAWTALIPTCRTGELTFLFVVVHLELLAQNARRHCRRGMRLHEAFEPDLESKFQPPARGEVILRACGGAGLRTPFRAPSRKDR